MTILKSILINFIIIVFISTSFSQTPYLFPGFPKNIDTLRSPYQKIGIPLVADLNNDGIKEIVSVGCDYQGLSSTPFMLHVIKINGQELTGFPKGYYQAFYDIALGDINKDGFIDIAIRMLDTIDAIDHNGNHLQGFPVYYPSLQPVAIWTPSNFINLYDLDGDGFIEIITGQYGALAVIDHNGQMKSGWPRPIVGRIRNNPAIGDLDKDGKAEIVYTQNKELLGMPSIDSAGINIIRYNGTPFSANWPIYYDTLCYTFLSSPTIFIGQTSNQSYLITVLNKDGVSRKYIKYDLNGEILNTFFYELEASTNDMSMIMGDINKDGQLEYTTGGFNGGYMDTYLFSNSFNVMQGWPQTGSSVHYKTPAIVKLTASSNLNLLISGSTPESIGYVYAYDQTGNQLPWSPLRPIGIVKGQIVSDIDNNGSIELITTNAIQTNTFFINIWTIPGIPFNHTDFPWPQYCHDRYKSNQYGFIPPDEPIGIQPISNEVPNKFSLEQNYPNPFNPSTTIKFSVPSVGQRHAFDLRLAVFDILGREVSQIVNEKLSPGTYSVSFDGSNLSSGVYYYRLTADGVMIDAKKMLLVK